MFGFFASTFPTAFIPDSSGDLSHFVWKKDTVFLSLAQQTVTVTRAAR